ncbi:MAG: Flp pilus assembly protein CpaB [Alphaproteobacteria bacterium]
MMKNRAFLMLILGVVLAGFTVILVKNWVDNRTQAAMKSSQGMELTTIVVATKSLDFGDKLSRDVMREVPWPAANLPAGGFKSIDEVLNGTGDRLAQHRIEVGEPILQAKITGFGDRPILSSRISEDMRALSVRMNDVYGVAGFVMPGDRVDILLTRELEPDAKGKRDLATDILLQSVKVLGIDQDAAETNDKPRIAKAVTVEVTAEQAQKLTLAMQVGTLSLALRNHTNIEETRSTRVTWSDLDVANHPKHAAPAPVRAEPVDKRPSVTVIRGLESSTQKVPNDPS